MWNSKYEIIVSVNLHRRSLDKSCFPKEFSILEKNRDPGKNKPDIDA